MSRHRRRIKRATVWVGLAAAAAFICTPSFWNELVIRYHLMRLHNAPEYFATLLEEPQASLAHQALRQYVTSPEGSEMFLRSCLNLQFRRRVETWRQRGGKPKRRALMYFTETNGWLEPVWTGQLDGEGRAARRGLLLLLPVLNGRRITLSEYADVTFAVLDQVTAVSAFSGEEWRKDESSPAYMLLLELQ